MMNEGISGTDFTMFWRNYHADLPIRSPCLGEGDLSLSLSLSAGGDFMGIQLIP